MPLLGDKQYELLCIWSVLKVFEFECIHYL